ncbi:U11/U12 small nuclear ribonucleoprotein 25 kDa protein [Tanacetum coccineum]|uniref:U11/U12 small nuclear ribonucleoprotein 25 kDa protein n=1 Tax=Tanacetum coccineum TaxID=301880 RepID=A0ABQ5E829_9ASTR
MTEPSSTGVKDDDSVALEYNTNNVKKAKLNSTLAALLDDPVLIRCTKSQLYRCTPFNTLGTRHCYAWFLYLVGLNVMNSATVKDLKLAVKKKVNEMEQSKMGYGSSQATKLPVVDYDDAFGYLRRLSNGLCLWQGFAESSPEEDTPSSSQFGDTYNRREMCLVSRLN